MKAPNGCLQYHTANTGTISSFNFNNAAGVHLTDQDYSICIRPDRTACAICYYVDAQTDWGVGVPNGIAGIGVKGVDTNCGAPGIALFAKGGGNDLVQIPGGQCDSPDNNGALVALFPSDRYCGTSFGCMTAVDGTSTAGTVCTNQRPFKVSFKTDSVEYTNGDNEGGDIARARGFELSK